MAEDRLADVAGRYQIFEGSIGDRDALDAAFTRYKPTQVVSCVAHSVGKQGLMRAGRPRLTRPSRSTSPAMADSSRPPAAPG